MPRVKKQSYRTRNLKHKLYQRERRKNDPEYAEKLRKTSAECLRKKRESDPNFRESERKLEAIYRKRRKAYQQWKMQKEMERNEQIANALNTLKEENEDLENNTGFHIKDIEHVKERRRQNSEAYKQRMANDPEYRKQRLEKIKENGKRSYQRIKKKMEEDPEYKKKRLAQMSRQRRKRQLKQMKQEFQENNSINDIEIDWTAFGSYEQLIGIKQEFCKEEEECVEAAQYACDIIDDYKIEFIKEEPQEEY